MINFGDEAELFRKTGITFVRDLMEDGAPDDAPIGLRTDKRTMAEWLDYTSGDLSAAQLDRIERAWFAYLAAGISPSIKLHGTFQRFSSQVPDRRATDLPPSRIIDVFDRLLATDEEIRVKRAAEIDALEMRFRQIQAENITWWRSQPPIVRKWVFAAAVWAAMVVLYFYFFDPFNVGGWERMYDEEMIKFGLIALAPVAAGALAYVYQRWVR